MAVNLRRTRARRRSPWAGRRLGRLAADLAARRRPHRIDEEEMMTPLDRLKRMSRVVLCGVGAYLSASLLLPPHHVRWGTGVRNDLCFLVAAVVGLEALCWRFAPVPPPPSR